MPRIDPRLALIWRTPTTIQIGFPEAVVTRELNEREEVLLSALRSGANLGTLRALGGMHGMSVAAVDAFVEALTPSYQADARPRVRVGLDGHGPLAEWIALALRDSCDIRAVSPGRLDREWQPELVLIVANYAVSPGRAVAWLRREIPHRTVVAHDRTVAISHLVRAGQTPCLVCAMLLTADADDSHAAMLSQLAGRPAGALDRRTGFEVGARVSRIIDDVDTAPRAYSTSEHRLDVLTGEWTLAMPQYSPRCSCRALQETEMIAALARASHSVLPTKVPTSLPHA